MARFIKSLTRHPVASASTIIVGAFFLGLLLLQGCRPSTPDSASESTSSPPDNREPPWFEDVTDAWGFNFVHDPGPLGTYFTPQSMGSGAAVFDFDGDGLLDIYMLNYGGPTSKSTNRLFRQVSPGKFQDVTEGSGLGVPGYSHGVAIGDVNNDGLPDVLLTQFDGIKLFLNQGHGKFLEVPAAESGLVNLSWGMSAAFLDYDRDGWLDLVVVNYLDFDPSIKCWSLTGVPDYCGPRRFSPVTSKLFRNQGATPAAPGKPPGVRFKDVSFESGIGRLAGAGLGVVCADFHSEVDGERWPDIFVANDGNPNRLWINKKNGTFADEGLSRGVAYTSMNKAYAGMGVAVGDVNNDGLLDLYVTHLGVETNNLWVQSRHGEFRDKTVEYGLTALGWRGTGWGTVMCDFNQDGWVDIPIANGRIFRGGDAQNTGLGFWETYAEKNQLLANDGNGKFRDISKSNPAFCDYWNCARGMVCADFDNDGSMDLLITTLGGRARLFRNVAPNRGHWLKVRAIDPRLHNRDALGAEIRVKVDDKDKLRLINSAESYLCSCPPIAHFGLGPADQYQSIRVDWPDGLREVFPGGRADRQVILERGKGNKQ